MTLSEVLSGYMSAATYDEVPAVALDAAKRSLIDTIGVALAARGTAGTMEVLSLVKQEGAGEKSTIWSTATRTSPQLAAFANSVHAAALDYDSLHPATAVHPDIVIVPAVIAVGESERVSGKDALAAIALGEDLLCRLASSTRANSGWFYTSLHGAVASAAITAKLMRAQASEIADAMGLAFTSGAATQQSVVERNVSKRALAAFSAMNGVFCGRLAVAGFKGPHEIFEGRFGLYAMYEEGNIGSVTERLGQRFENVNIAIKPYPSCQANHAAIDGLLKLKAEHGLQPEDVAQIEVTVSPYTHRLVGAPFNPHGNPQVAAQFSMQYSIACVLLRGRLGIDEIQEDVVLDEKISQIAQHVVIRQDAENHNNYVPIQLSIKKRDGSVLGARVETVRGSAEAPLSLAKLREKFLACLEAADSDATDTEVDDFLERVDHLERETDLSGLLAATTNLIPNNETGAGA